MDEITAILYVSRVILRCVIHPFIYPYEPPMDLDGEWKKIRSAIYSHLFHNPLVTMKLTASSINLLKFVVSMDGKKEVNADGKEVDSPRRLNGEESCSRRMFMKEALRIEEDLKPEVQKIVDGYNSFLDERRSALKEANPKQEGEEDEAYNKRIGALLEADADIIAKFNDVKVKNEELTSRVHVIEVSEKVKEFLKKYYLLFGEEVGYVQGDDAATEELNGVFGL